MKDVFRSVKSETQKFIQYQRGHFSKCHLVCELLDIAIMYKGKQTDFYC